MFPNKTGWYWVLINGYSNATPCWYSEGTEYFLPAGLGDSSSMGIYMDDICKIGPEIIEPTF